MTNNKKTIEDLDKISREYWEGMGRLKDAQNRIVQEYIQRLEEEKKKEIMKKLAND